MANSAASHLEALKTARDAIVAAIAEGQLTVMYRLGRREVTVSDPVLALERIERSIEIYEKKASRAATSPFRLAKLGRAC
jgi:hypothetical protein